MLSLNPRINYSDQWGRGRKSHVTLEKVFHSGPVGSVAGRCSGCLPIRVRRLRNRRKHGDSSVPA